MLSDLTLATASRLTTSYSTPILEGEFTCFPKSPPEKENLQQKAELGLNDKMPVLNHIQAQFWLQNGFDTYNYIQNRLSSSWIPSCSVTSLKWRAW